jgi:integrase
MASKPFLDPRRDEWVMKHRPDPAGPWVRVVLGKREGKANKVPFEIQRKYEQFRDAEFAARHGLKPVPVKSIKLDDYLQAYLESKSLTSAVDSIRQLGNGIKRFVVFAKSRNVTTLQGVNRPLCREYLESRMRLVAGSTLRMERGFLIGAWSRAVEDGLIAGNPWAGARVQGTIEPTSITFWTGEEIAAIVAACTVPWQADLVELLANTGLRVSTALVSRWEWVDRDWTKIQIRKQPRVKTGYTHVLSASAREILRCRKESSGDSPLFFQAIRGGGEVPYASAQGAIRTAIERAKVRPGTPHDFRHSYGRTLGLAGVPVTVIQRQLGHTSLAMTLKYVAVDEEHVGRFVEGIAIGTKKDLTHPDRPET